MVPDRLIHIGRYRTGEHGQTVLPNLLQRLQLTDLCDGTQGFRMGRSPSFP